MLYLNEDAVDSQIKTCTKQAEDPNGVKCPACCKVKLKDKICPLGQARMSPLQK